MQVKQIYVAWETNPFYILPECLTVAGPKNLKLNVRVWAFGAEVHLSCQAADSSLYQQNVRVLWETASRTLLYFIAVSVGGGQ